MYTPPTLQQSGTDTPLVLQHGSGQVPDLHALNIDFSQMIDGMPMLGSASLREYITSKVQGVHAVEGQKADPSFIDTVVDIVIDNSVALLFAAGVGAFAYLRGRKFSRIHDEFISHTGVSIIDDSERPGHKYAKYLGDHRILLHKTFQPQEVKAIQRWIYRQMQEQDNLHRKQKRRKKQGTEFIQIPGHDQRVIAQLQQNNPTVAQLMKNADEWWFKMGENGKDNSKIETYILGALQRFSQSVHSHENAALERMTGSCMIRVQKAAALMLENPATSLKCLRGSMRRVLRYPEFNIPDIELVYDAMLEDWLKLYEDEKGDPFIYLRLPQTEGAPGERLYLESETIFQRIIMMAYLYPWRHELESCKVMRYTGPRDAKKPSPRDGDGE